MCIQSVQNAMQDVFEVGLDRANVVVLP